MDTASGTNSANTEVDNNKAAAKTKKRIVVNPFTKPVRRHRGAEFGRDYQSRTGQRATIPI
ncbi:MULTISPECIES: hypothetical protein [Pseudomonas]|uniref:hypothetical protein n=1 Tax=Pseudomonas TaxID=286 RepID=UPI0015A195D9|nr:MULTISPECIES: hypothetical protein [Pseudomonas]NWE03108.1 hypothetical protein [Pseudomonas sp. IPO3749]NWF20498.1 hypothetical protein [Pseudomonas sp. IPO3749]